MGYKAVFLDRDGTINREYAYGYITDPKLLFIDPPVYEAIGRINALRIPIAIITNQQGVGKGLMTDEQLTAVHDEMTRRFNSAHIWVDAIYVCPHLEGTCECRKPKPALLLKAAEFFQVPIKDCIMIGNRDSDVLAGIAAGCDVAKIATPDDLLGAVDILLGELPGLD